ncbi:RING finger protein nhl 1 [Elysia marginata]|uniref:RING finger protein nhl 1 n=1 Tax=Elysia marginata TaxID=1093978 RepID=A0AAV4JYY5_9GAST|nr:RING finger protein nhl 1 [Elysia marginata]
MAQKSRGSFKKNSTQLTCQWGEWRYTKMKDEDFEDWVLCRKCHEPLRIPKTLPCLHTVCLRCLQVHYRIVRKQVRYIKETNPNKYDFLNWGGCFTCPWCAFPCYTIGSDLSTFPNNKRLLALSYMERLTRLKEIEKCKELNTTNTSGSSSQLSGSIPQGSQSYANSECTNSDIPGTSCSLTVEQQDSIDNVIISSHFNDSSGQKQKLISMHDALAKHHEFVRRECRVMPEEILGELETVCPSKAKLSETLNEYGYAHHCGSYGLVWGDAELEIHAPSAVAINPSTRHVVVVDSMLNKALLFKNDLSKPWAYKQFHRPIMDVCFYPSGFMEAAVENGYDEMKMGRPIEFSSNCEMFMAMGRNLKSKGIIIYRVPFTKEPWEYSDLLQNVVRDVSGILLLSEGRLCLSLGYANTLLLQIVHRPNCPDARVHWSPKFIDLATRHSHGLFNPTHLIQGGPGQMIVSDTNNHRIGVFYGQDYLASDFYCEFGHGKGQLFYPLGLAMDSSRHLFICDAGNHRVQVLNRCFSWHGFPIRATYRMGKSVSQDVKPIDCAMDAQNRLLVLFRGRQYVSLQVRVKNCLIGTVPRFDVSEKTKKL